MRVIVIGGTGTIGSAVVRLLSTRHDVVTVGHKRGTYQVDLASPDSITSLFKTIGTCDAVVSTAGIAKFASLDDLTYDDYFIGLKNKLMGQANLVRIGRPFVTNHGSFTLTSGVLSQEPMKGSCAISMANAGLEGFVRAAAIEAAITPRTKALMPVQYGQRGTGRICSRRCHRPAAKPARECRQPSLGDGNTDCQRHGPVDRPAG